MIQCIADSCTILSIVVTVGQTIKDTVIRCKIIEGCRQTIVTIDQDASVISSCSFNSLKSTCGKVVTYVPDDVDL